MVASGIVEEPTSQETGAQAQLPGGGGARSQLVQRLLDAASLPQFMESLLTTQAITVAGTEAAGFLIEQGGENAFSLRPIAHIRPDGSTAETRTAALNAFQELVRPCIQQGKDGAIEVGAPNDASELQFCLVTLLRADANVVAVSAVITRCINLERAKQRLVSMQLVAGYFELFTLRRIAEQSKTVAESHQHAMQLSTAVATAEGFESAAMNLCNELATRAGATRVSMGWIKGRNIRVRALSHTEEFDKKQELIVLLEKVMEECYDQDQVVQYDPNGQSTDNVTRNAQALSRNQGGHGVLSLPLRRREEIVGVVTLEFLANHQLNPSVSRGLAVSVELLAPQLYDRHQNDRWLATKAAIATKDTAKMLIGPKHTLGKIIGVSIAAGLFILVQGFWMPMYHVSAPFQFAAIEPQTVSAPYDGYIGKIGTIEDPVSHTFRKLKPGDKVKAGDVLLELDTVDTKMKHAEARMEMASERKEAAKDLSEHKTAEQQIALDKAAQAEAQMNFLQSQIDRAIIRAPRDGQILKGDLEDKLGAPVKTGDGLFEIGSPDNLRVELSVSDRDMLDIKPNQTGRFATNALPDGKYDFTVERIIPLGEPKEGGNVFKVYGTIKASQVSESWRPGMAGEARVNVEPRRIIWIWTHRLVDFLKLKLWM
ncbi:MAG: HlyD family secretion protein [Phycisphaerales bacterium]|nr:HlyD family secretion protein [Phycisphaerales bacterium]MDB5354074.1 HlyD family secretion protein [Phycisphaerales bacterium]